MNAITLKYKLLSYISRNKVKFSAVFFKVFFSWRKTDDNKIVICCHGGRGIGCNPKYIADEIIRQNLPYKIVWLVRKEFKDQHEKGKYSNVKFVDYTNIFARLKELSTAKLWIDNTWKLQDIKIGLEKKPKQFYLQTWHGSLGIKKIGEDAAKFWITEEQKNMCFKDFKSYDLMISNSKFEEDVFRNALKYEGKIIRTGHPRNDIFFIDNTKIKNKVYNDLKIQKNAKIALYAPSYRDDLRTDCYKLDYARVKATLNNKFEGEWDIVSRFHPSNLRQPSFLSDKASPIDASYYPDMQELLASVDLLISDYSSSMFDFMLTQKPCFVYGEDIKKYNTERGFYYPLETTPFPIAENNEQLFENIKKFDNEIYKKNCEKFLQERNVTESGNAAKKTVRIIKFIMRKKSNRALT